MNTIQVTVRVTVEQLFPQKWVYYTCFELERAHIKTNFDFRVKFYEKVHVQIRLNTQNTQIQKIHKYTN